MQRDAHLFGCLQEVLPVIVVCEIVREFDREFKGLVEHQIATIVIEVIEPLEGYLVAFGCANATLKVWDVFNNNQVWARPHRLCCSSIKRLKKGKFVSAAGNQFAYVWDTATGRCDYEIPGTESEFSLLSALAPLSGGTRVAFSAQDSTVDIWDVVTGDCLQTLQGHTRQVVVAVALAPQDSFLVTSSHDRTTRVWDTIDGSCLFTVQESTTNLVQIKGNKFSMLTANAVEVWDASTGQQVCSLPFEKHEQVSCIEVVDETHFAIGAMDGALYFWDFNKRKLMMAGWRKSITQLVRLDKRHVAALAGDIKVWNTATGADFQLRHFNDRGGCSCEPKSAAYLQNGVFVMSYSCGQTFILS